MAKVAVIGAAMGGLACALFLARRGHQVDLFERDADAPPDDPRQAFASWTRRGVAQARQAHLFLGLSAKVLSEEAPDVIAALMAAGANEIEPTIPVDIGVPVFAARRLAYEAVLRGAVAAERNVTLHAGAKVDGLLAEDRGGVPQVVGLRTEAGEAHRADLVVDAGGRWTSAADWLAAIGARPWGEQAFESPFVYMTRYFRLKPGVAFPSRSVPQPVDLSYGGCVAFHGDGDTFALALITSKADPCAKALARNERFDAVFAELPALSDWLAAGEPLNEVHALGRIDNRSRSLVEEGAPVVTGFVLLGDSSLHTNPSFGRGVSLAFAHAQQLARTAEQAADDPSAFALGFQAWTDANIAVWYSSAAQADQAKIAQMEASFRGEAPGRPPGSALGAAITAMIRDDLELARRWVRFSHLLETPAQIFADAALMGRIQAEMAANPAPHVDALPRARYEAILAG